MNKKKIPRKYVNDVINETKDLLLQISTVLKQEINKSELVNFDQLIDNTLNCLNIVYSEYKRFSLFTKL